MLKLLFVLLSIYFSSLLMFYLFKKINFYVNVLMEEEGEFL